MVSAYSGSCVGGEVLSSEARRVAVHGPPRPGLDFLQHPALTRQHSRHIHHLPQSQYLRVGEEGGEVPRVQVRPCGLQLCGGHTRGKHEEDREGEPAARGEHVADAVEAHDVGYLVGVGDDGGGPPGHHRAGELRGRHHGALDVDVALDETRSQVASAKVNRLPGLVVPEAGNHSPGNGDGDLLHLGGEDVHDAAASEEKVRGLSPPGGSYRAGQVPYHGSAFSCPEKTSKILDG